MQVPGFQGSAVPGFGSATAARAQAWFIRRTWEPRNLGTSEPNGWTLIELLIVISIIMILASMSLVTYRNSVTLAKEAALHSDLFMMRDAIDQYYADKGKYPETLQSLVTDNYMRAIPKDPFTNSSDTWQTVDAEPQPGSTAAGPGIYEVKSGSDGTAIDGSKFSDW
jgi:general secretion pathway protein G